MIKESPRILLVEDEMDVCSSIQSYLGRRNYLVSTTSSGRETIAIIKASKPDLILLDLTLPDMDGREILRLIREFDANVKIVIITGNLLKPEEIKHIGSLGITKYLNKPIPLDKLEIIIRNIFDGKVPEEKIKTGKKARYVPKTNIKTIIHDLSNKLGIIRNKCENFTANIEDGVDKNKTDKEIVHEAFETMKVMMETVDQAMEVVEEIPKILEKNRKSG